MKKFCNWQKILNNWKLEVLSISIISQSPQRRKDRKAYIYKNNKINEHYVFYEGINVLFLHFYMGKVILVYNIKEKCVNLKFDFKLAQFLSLLASLDVFC